MDKDNKENKNEFEPVEPLDITRRKSPDPSAEASAPAGEPQPAPSGDAEPSGGAEPAADASAPAVPAPSDGEGAARSAEKRIADSVEAALMTASTVPAVSEPDTTAGRAETETRNRESSNKRTKSVRRAFLTFICKPFVALLAAYCIVFVLYTNFAKLSIEFVNKCENKT